MIILKVHTHGPSVYLSDVEGVGGGGGGGGGGGVTRSTRQRKPLISSPKIGITGILHSTGETPSPQTDGDRTVFEWFGLHRHPPHAFRKRENVTAAGYF